MSRPELIESIAGMRARISQVRRAERIIGLVPTMGALHRGHATLIERARQESGFVAVSVFVNPAQFDRKDDFEQYARTLPADLDLCASLGVDAVFVPASEEMGTADALTSVEVQRLSKHLCGPFRPSHFRGVATVVAQLFNIVQPDRAYFGEKDAQQLTIIQRMVSDLHFPLQIVPVPTVREADGLALSSRNSRLSPRERAIAPALYRALREAKAKIEAGIESADTVKQCAREVLQPAPDIRIEYFDIVDTETLQPVERISGKVLIAAAVWLGTTRLIDNMPAEDAKACG